MPLLDAANGSGSRQTVVPHNGSSQEALQALLAFSALHEQVREHRDHSGGKSRSEDGFTAQQFALHEVLQLVAERALALTGADGVAIALAEGEAIICRAAAGTVAPDPGAHLDPNSGFSGACLASGRIVRCDDSELDPRVDAGACRNLGARSMVAVPLLARQTVIGLVEAFSTEAYGFNDSDVRSLDLLAELILSALRPEEEDRLTEISERVVGRPANGPVEREEQTATEPPPQFVQEDTAAAEDSEPFPAVAGAAPYAVMEPSRPGLGLVIALVLFAVGLGLGLWWQIRRHRDSRTVSTPSAMRANPESGSGATGGEAAAAAVEAASLPENEGSQEPAPPENTSATPEVTGIRHWSSGDSSTVVIDLQDQVQYEVHRLANPERIYFDLHDTKLAAALSGKTIDVGDELIQRVRVAQPVHGVTRVVLETKGGSNFSVSLEPNPYRIVVEVRKIGAPPQARTRINLFAPADQGSPTQNAANTAIHPLTPNFRIALDAGHGGWDLGTVGRKGLLEKDLVLDIVSRLGRLVETRLGAEVVYTRKDDSFIALEKRAEIANLAQVNLFLSIHANYSDFPSARGVETYYTNTYSSVRARSAEDNHTPGLQNINWTNVDIRAKVIESRKFAGCVQHALFGMLAAKNPGLPNRGVKEAQYVVLTGASMPAVLAEVSFVSSPTDENNLQSSSYRQQIAEALYQGVARYAEERDRVKVASASIKTSGR